MQFLTNRAIIFSFLFSVGGGGVLLASGMDIEQKELNSNGRASQELQEPEVNGNKEFPEWKEKLKTMSEAFKDVDQDAQETLKDIQARYDKGLLLKEEFDLIHSKIEEALQNSPAQQYFIGRMYLNKQILPIDYTKALKWTTLAASQEDLLAISALSRLLKEPKKIPHYDREDISALQSELEKVAKEKLGEYFGVF